MRTAATYASQSRKNALKGTSVTIPRPKSTTPFKTRIRVKARTKMPGK